MKLAFTTVVILGLVLALLFWARAESQVALDVALNFTSGERQMLSDYRGEPLLVAFWSVHCSPCIKDMPKLAQLHTDGLKVLAISIPQDPPALVIDLSNKLRPPYPTVLDVHSEISQSFGGVHVTPTHFLLNADGRVALRSSGPLDIAHIKELLKL